VPALSGKSGSALQVGPRTILRHVRLTDEEEFLARVKASRRLHGRLVSAPSTPSAFRAWAARAVDLRRQLHLVCRRDDGAICGVMSLTGIVRDPLHSANLGYLAMVPYAGQGYMREGIELLLAQAFRRLKLHRVEAWIHPANAASIALASRAGLRYEGCSPRYLKVGGRWHDMLRFALCVEEWRAARRASSRART
jgi:ribosomal-protein-alanine N-acetyltransferase